MEKRNKNIIFKLVLITIGIAIIYQLLELVRDYVPERIVEWDEVIVNTIGLLLLLVFVVTAILVPNILNKYEPELSEFKIALFTGIIIFTSECLLKLFQVFFIISNGSMLLDFIPKLIPILLISILVMLFASIRIYHIRKKRKVIPVLLLIAYFILLGLYLI